MLIFLRQIFHWFECLKLLNGWYLATFSDDVVFPLCFDHSRNFIPAWCICSSILILGIVNSFLEQLIPFHKLVNNSISNSSCLFFFITFLCAKWSRHCSITIAIALKWSIGVHSHGNSFNLWSTRNKIQKRFLLLSFSDSWRRIFYRINTKGKIECRWWGLIISQTRFDCLDRRTLRRYDVINAIVTWLCQSCRFIIQYRATGALNQVNSPLHFIRVMQNINIKSPKNNIFKWERVKKSRRSSNVSRNSDIFSDGVLCTTRKFFWRNCCFQRSVWGVPK